MTILYTIGRPWHILMPYIYKTCGRGRRIIVNEREEQRIYQETEQRQQSKKY
jgi:hypothetical protein